MKTGRSRCTPGSRTSLATETQWSKVPEILDIVSFKDLNYSQFQGFGRIEEVLNGVCKHDTISANTRIRLKSEVGCYWSLLWSQLNSQSLIDQQSAKWSCWTNQLWWFSCAPVFSDDRDILGQNWWEAFYAWSWWLHWLAVHRPPAG